MNFKKDVIRFYEKNKDNEEKMIKLFDLFACLVTDEIKQSNIEIYNDFIDEFEEYVDFIEDEEYINAMSMLKKKDGSPGAKWTDEEIEGVIEQFNIKDRLGEDFCHKKFYFAINYAYATHCSPNRTLSSYVDLAVDEYLDQNICIKDKILILSEKFNEQNGQD